MQGGTSTFLFTDLVGSTQLIERLGDDVSDPLIRSLLARLRAVVIRHRGTVVKSLGDGLMAAFSSAAAAVDAAAQMQQVAAAMAAEGPAEVQLRVGINAGEAVYDGIDYYGKPVWVAQRYCDAATAGQILVSEVVRDLVGTRGGHVFVSRGEVALKGVSQPAPALEVEWQPDPDLDLVSLDVPPRAARRWLVPVVALATVLIVGLAYLLLSTEGEPGSGPRRDETTEAALRPRAVSVRQDRSLGEAEAGTPSVANGGRLVVYATASRLTRIDTNEVADVYLYNSASREPVLVSVSPDGIADAGSFDPQISGNGRRIVFVSRATNLVPGVADGLAHIYAYTLGDGSLRVLDRRVNGDLAVRDSESPSVSFTGDFAAFASAARNLAVAGDRNGTTDVFRHDIGAGITNRDSVPASRDEPNGPSSEPAISPDGFHVAFTSDATNLVPGDGPERDVFLYRHTQRMPVQISEAVEGEADGPSSAPAVADRGAAVAFESDATNLIDGDTNDVRDIFVWTEEGIVRASETSSGDEADGESYGANISADGRFVAFLSDATNLVADDGNDAPDAFLKDLRTGSVRRLSVTSEGEEVEAPTTAVALARNGRHCAFVAPAGAVDPRDYGSAEVPTVFLLGPLF